MTVENSANLRNRFPLLCNKQTVQIQKQSVEATANEKENKQTKQNKQNKQTNKQTNKQNSPLHTQQQNREKKKKKAKTSLLNGSVLRRAAMSAIKF